MMSVIIVTKIVLRTYTFVLRHSLLTVLDFGFCVVYEKQQLIHLSARRRSLFLCSQSCPNNNLLITPIHFKLQRMTAHERVNRKIYGYIRLRSYSIYEQVEEAFDALPWQPSIARYDPFLLFSICLEAP
jgi:hypothetical protein